jgi:hypothetical protein
MSLDKCYGRVNLGERGRMMGGAKPQPPQIFKPADFQAWVRAELVMRPLSGLEMARARQS